MGQSAANHTRKHRGEPLLLTISALGSSMCFTQLMGPTALRPLEDEAIMVKCLAEGHKFQEQYTYPYSAG